MRNQSFARVAYLSVCIGSVGCVGAGVPDQGPEVLSLNSAVGGQGNPNPGVIPNQGNNYGDLGARWWQWALSFPFADVPYFNSGGAVDLSAGQSGHIWYLAGANNHLNSPRTGSVPAGTQLFFPVANLENDYPCPAEFNFEPDPGESLEHFLVRTGNGFIPNLGDLFATIDGAPLSQLERYRSTSPLFEFTADPALVSFDPCITGGLQPAISIGYWLLLAPLSPGAHRLHFGAPSWGQDVTYDLTVK